MWAGIECKSLHTGTKSKPKQTRANSEETERKLKGKINRMASVRIIVQTLSIEDRVNRFSGSLPSRTELICNL